LDRSAVHVELTVSNLVQPGPSKGVSAVRDRLRHGDREGGSTVTESTFVRKVTGNVRRAASDNTVDDLPLRSLGGLTVGGDRELA
jgi:hypothetical protein